MISIDEYVDDKRMSTLAVTLGVLFILEIHNNILSSDNMKPLLKWVEYVCIAIPKDFLGIVCETREWKILIWGLKQIHLKGYVRNLYNAIQSYLDPSIQRNYN